MELIDTDSWRNILLHVRYDNMLFLMLRTNKYFSTLCDEYFWYRRFINTYKFDLDKYGKINYKSLYLRLSCNRVRSNLRYAVGNGYLEIILYYITMKKINRQNGLASIINWAAYSGQLDIIKYLNNKSIPGVATIRVGFGGLLNTAVRHNQLSLVKYSLNNFSYSRYNYVSHSYVEKAIKNDNLEMVKYLISRCPHLLMSALLHTAMTLGNKEIIDFLTEFSLTRT